MPRFSDRLTPRTPKYRKHRASGQAVVTLSGHDYYLGPYATKASRTEYDRLVAEWLAGGWQLPGTGGSDLTVVELCAAFLRHARAYYRKDGRPTSTVGGIEQAIAPLARLYGRTPVAEFGPKRLKALRHGILQTGRANRTTINKRVRIIRQMFEWGVAEELVSPSIYQALAAVKGLRKGRTAAREPVPVPPVPVEVVEATLPHVFPVVADMVRLQRLTGCRPSEVCQVRPMDIDRTGDIWVYRPASHKTEHHERSRVIFIGPKAQAVLSDGQRQLVDVVQEVGHRLTTTGILEALGGKGLIVSEGTTKSNLAFLVKMGHLTNRRDVRPAGYGLPEWG